MEKGIKGLFNTILNQNYKMSSFLSFKVAFTQKKFEREISKFSKASVECLGVAFFVVLLAKIFLEGFTQLELYTVVLTVSATVLSFKRTTLGLRLGTFAICLVNEIGDSEKEWKFMFLVSDWLGHLYTLKSWSSYAVLSVLKVAFVCVLYEKGFVMNVAVHAFLTFFMCLLEKDIKDIWVIKEGYKRGALQQKEVLEFSQTAILILDESGKILDFNHKAKSYVRILGFSDISDMQFTQIFESRVSELLETALAKAKKGQSIQELILMNPEFQDPRGVLLMANNIPYNKKNCIQVTLVEVTPFVAEKLFKSGLWEKIDQLGAKNQKKLIDKCRKGEQLEVKDLLRFEKLLLKAKEIDMLDKYFLGQVKVKKEVFDFKLEISNLVETEWKSIKKNKLKVRLSREKGLHQPVKNDREKHNQAFKGFLKFVLKHAKQGSEVNIHCSRAVSFIKSVGQGFDARYKFTFYPQENISQEIDYLFQVRRDYSERKTFEEIILMSEKYGVSVAIFDFVLLALEGYVCEPIIQEDTNKVVLSYM